MALYFNNDTLDVGLNTHVLVISDCILVTLDLFTSNKRRYSFLNIVLLTFILSTSERHEAHSWRFSLRALDQRGERERRKNEGNNPPPPPPISVLHSGLRDLGHSWPQFQAFGLFVEDQRK